MSKDAGAVVGSVFLALGVLHVWCEIIAIFFLPLRTSWLFFLSFGWVGWVVAGAREAVEAPAYLYLLLVYVLVSYAPARRGRRVSCASCMGPFVKASFAKGACPNTRTPFKVMRLDPSGKLPN